MDRLLEGAAVKLGSWPGRWANARTVRRRLIPAASGVLSPAWPYLPLSITLANPST
jgi:hypothetical protein